MLAEHVPEPILQHWYECGRKIRYHTESIGWLTYELAHHAIGRTPVKRPYLCPQCGYWHMGRGPNPMRTHRDRVRRERNMRTVWDNEVHRRESHWRSLLGRWSEEA